MIVFNFPFSLCQTFVWAWGEQKYKLDSKDKGDVEGEKEMLLTTTTTTRFGTVPQEHAICGWLYKY